MWELSRVFPSPSIALLLLISVALCGIVWTTGVSPDLTSPSVAGDTSSVTSGAVHCRAREKWSCRLSSAIKATSSSRDAHTTLSSSFFPPRPLSLGCSERNAHRSSTKFSVVETERPSASTPQLHRRQGQHRRARKTTVGQPPSPPDVPVAPSIGAIHLPPWSGSVSSGPHHPRPHRPRPLAPPSRWGAATSAPSPASPAEPPAAGSDDLPSPPEAPPWSSSVPPRRAAPPSSAAEEHCSLAASLAAPVVLPSAAGRPLPGLLRAYTRQIRPYAYASVRKKPIDRFRTS